MANKKISQLTNSLTKATADTADILPVVDTSASETKKMTYGELMSPTDANFRIAGSADNTKLVAFEVDGLTTATTRTVTIPDANTTMVGTDTTQTLTNKTLTAPQINMGSDATGDMYYRNGSATTTRLPIGTSAQILQVSASGIPEWIANPSASAASTSAAGVVELATTAETETGTDATRAVTPDGLHDMTSLAGAAWFLDEDTMSSDSATKTVSQQSVKAYVDSKTGVKNGVTTRALATASGSQTIAHGLGRTPTTVRITGIVGISTGGSNYIFSSSHGIYNGTTTSCVYQGSNSNSQAYQSTSSTNIISLVAPDINSTTPQVATVSVDSTNITLAWTQTGSPTSTAQIMWEAA